MTYKSAKEWFNSANGRQVTKTVQGALTIEQWPERVADIVAQLTAQGCNPSDIVTDESGLHVKTTGQFVMRPKLRAYEVGKLLVRSADYAFIPEGQERGVYGDKKGAKIEGDSLVKTYDNGMIVTFTILPESGI